MILTDDDKKFIKETFEKCTQEEKDCFEVKFNSYEEIYDMYINDVLRLINALILYKGFDKNYNLNNFGRKLQRMYDKIYYQNIDDDEDE